MLTSFLRMLTCCLRQDYRGLTDFCYTSLLHMLTSLPPMLTSLLTMLTSFLHMLTCCLHQDYRGLTDFERINRVDGVDVANDTC